MKRLYYVDLPTCGLCAWGAYLWRAARVRQWFEYRGEMCLIVDASALVSS